MRVKSPSLSLFLALVFATSAAAQDGAEKKILTIDDYRKWRSVGSTSISDDGAWVTYAYSQREKDSILRVAHTQSDKVHEIPRGSRPQLSDDSKWVAYTLTPPVKEAEKLREANKPVINQAELLDLETGDKKTWDNVASFTFSKGSKLLAIKRNKSDSDAEHDGTDLILCHLDDGTEELLGSVSAFSFNKPGGHLAYTVSAADKNGNGIYLLDAATGMRRPLDNGKMDYGRMAWDEEGTALAVLKGKEEEKLEHRINTLLVFHMGEEGPTRTEYDPSAAFDFPKDKVISELGAVSFNEDSTKVFFSIKSQEAKPSDEDKESNGSGADSSDEVDVADVDIWHWRDRELQSVQQNRVAAARNRNYRAVLNLDSKRCFQLTDDKMRSISITRDGKWGIGQDDHLYVSDWKERLNDIYAVNTETGERTMLLEAQGRTLGLSPDSQNFLYWKGEHIWRYDLATDAHSNMTEGSGVSFVNLQEDHFGPLPPYGVTGWTADGRGVVLNHQYDLYLQPLDGGAAVNLTGGTGTNNEIRFRYIRTDSEARFIDLEQPILLSAYGQWTKDSGFYSLENGRLTELIYTNKSFSNPNVAKNADLALYSIQSFRDFPDYYVSDLTFSVPKKITDTNPQQLEYRWGRRILFDYTNKDGVPLQGTLAIPDSYQEGQKLPMIVNFYEKNSQNLNRYTTPRNASSPNFAGYVSDGYLAMQPDVHFNLGRTGDDMLDCVEAAVRKVIEMGYADPERIGLHGHSFSGMGAAYISVRSDMFAAVLAGAATTNLLNDFNNLWPGGGQNNHRYDIYGQGRYATNPYEDLELYLDQSPVNHAHTTTTPLMLLHGTADGTVPWIQGVDMFNALRFNEKSVILLSYPGEGHGLRQFPNQVDFQKRLRQFFDHYLKGKPAPRWMVRGRSYLEKEQALKANKKK